MKIQKVTKADGIGKMLGYVTFWFMVGFIPTFLMTIGAGLLADEYEKHKDK